jgi:uncharacterized protein
MDMHPRIEGLIKVGSRLIDVMEREIEMLREMRAGDLKALASDKDTLVAAYEECMAALKGDDTLIAAASPAIKDELMRIAAKLNATVAANERALSAAKAANERLLKAVVDAVAADRQRGAAYSKNGARTAPSVRNTKPVSLNIDTRL